MTSTKIKKPEQTSILGWLQDNRIRNEKGQLIDLRSHLFLADIFTDRSQNLVVMKGAQVGMTTTEILKNHYDAKSMKMDIIFTSPTDNDTRVMVGGKVNRIIANNPCMLEDVADKDSVEQKAVGESMIYFRGCVDQETEVLTEKGWTRHSDISVGDKLPTLNIKTNEVEMDKVLDITRFKTDEEMVRIKSSLVDQLVTKDHRCVISKRTFKGDKSALRIQRAHEMVGKKSAHIPTRFSDPDNKIKEDPLYKIVGWVIGDGSYWTKRNKSTFVKKDGSISPKVYETERVCIIQSKFCEELEKDLDDAGITYYKKPHGTSFRYELHTEFGKNIRKIAPEKKLTHKMVFSMSQPQRYSLLKGLMMSDGDNVKHTSFWQRKNGTCDALQAMLVLLGYTSNKSDVKSQPNRYGTQQQERVRIRKNYWTNPVVTTELYQGIAWCPTTKNGTIFIRRNGKVSVTGQTWSKKAAMSVTADRVVHDEKDASKLDVIADYQARLQHSNLKQTHTFSHPSFPETGVHADWLQSDQRHWFIKCPHCKHWQFLSWNTEDPSKMSIDLERRIFICKKCKKELDNETRRVGQWVPKYKDKKWTGYWVSLLMAPWMSADDLVDRYNSKEMTQEFWYTKILGLPFADGASKLIRQHFFSNLTGKSWAPDEGQRIVIGIDTGLRIDYVMGNKHGLFYHGDTTDYDELDGLMKRYPKAIAVIDAGGDLIGSRKFYERWPGRVFLCYLQGDRKTKELVVWGKGDEQGSVRADRNRIIQLCVDEFRDKRVPVHGTQDDWFEYWLDWNNLTKTKVLDPETNETKGYKWIRSGRDHRALATVFWRVGMMRFAGMGSITMPQDDKNPNSYYVNPDNTADFDPKEMYHKGVEESLDAINENSGEWRK